jgi:hypothetical protein
VSKFYPGQKVRFRRLDGKIVEDVVRACYTAQCLVEPYGENLSYPALVLTKHSWCAESAVVPADECPECKGTGWCERSWDSAPIACIFCDEVKP